MIHLIQEPFGQTLRLGNVHNVPRYRTGITTGGNTNANVDRWRQWLGLAAKLGAQTAIANAVSPWKRSFHRRFNSSGGNSLFTPSYGNEKPPSVRRSFTRERSKVRSLVPPPLDPQIQRLSDLSPFSRAPKKLAHNRGTPILPYPPHTP